MATDQQLQVMLKEWDTAAYPQFQALPEGCLNINMFVYGKYLIGYGLQTAVARVVQGNF